MSFLSKPIHVYFSPNKKFSESLYNILGFYPKNVSLYKLAFRHSSASIEIKEGIKNSNERLEFLGDSIIGCVVTDYLFKKYPFKDEGFLTKTRSKIVSREKHNQIALKLGLNKFVEINNISLKGKSSIYGNAYEALIGAIYLDKGYVCAHKFIVNRIISFHIDMEEIEFKEIDFKSKFIEWAQKEKKDFVFEMLLDGAISEDKQFLIQLKVGDEIVGATQHFSKKRAEQLVAEQVCLLLNI